MKYNAVSLISRIKESADSLIKEELRTAGYESIMPSHGDILHILYNDCILSMHEIAKKIHRTKATTTVLVDKLEKMGMVKKVKSEKDNRYTFVNLTQKGKKFKPVFEKISKKLNDKIYSNIQTEQIEILENLLLQLRTNLE